MVWSLRGVDPTSGQVVRVKAERCAGAAVAVPERAQLSATAGHQRAGSGRLALANAASRVGNRVTPSPNGGRNTYSHGPSVNRLPATTTALDGITQPATM